MKRFYLSRLIIPIAILLGWNLNAYAQTTTFSSAGGPYTYTVPLGVTSIGVDMAGAQGADANNGGNGGRVTCNLAVTGGQVLYVFVGGQPSGATAGINGGGSATGSGGGGGGASDIRTVNGAYSSNLNTRLVVAGGGGGKGTTCGTPDNGGPGGNPGGSGTSPCYGSNAYGYGATTGGPGNGAPYGGGTGSLGFGQNSNGCCWSGGGGGGGYYGGGGGYYSGGGGGSSYAPGAPGNATSNILYTTGFQPGNGYVIIYGPTLTTTSTSLNFGQVASGTLSAPAQYFAMNGSYMGVSPLTITAPANYEVSTNGTVWSVPGGSVTFAYSGSTISSIASPYSNIYVKFVAPTLPGTYCGNVVISGGGLTTPVNVNVCGNSAALCTGAVSAGAAVALPTTGGVATQFVLSLSGASASGGLTYQWQSSPSGSPGTFTPIAGAIQSTYSFTGIAATTYYNCVVTCPGGSAQTSSNVTVTYQAPLATSVYNSSCTPSSSLLTCNTSISSGSTNPFKITGAGNTILSDPSPCGSNRYWDQTGTGYTCTMSAGGTYPAIIGYNGGGSGNFTSCQVWIDFNNSGTFDVSEIVAGGANWSSTQLATNVIIPAGVTPGIYRMRVVTTFSNGWGPGANSTYPCYPQIPSCPTTTVQQAETRDYNITIGPGPCTAALNPGMADISVTSGCTGGAQVTTNLYDVGSSQTTGVTYQWLQSPTPGSYFACSGTSNKPVYTATVTAVGTTYYVCNVTCGGTTIQTNPQVITLNTPPAPIGGILNECIGQPYTLVSSPGGGNWSSSNTGIATIGSLGNVNAITVGNATISYTMPSTGCSATALITVNPSPAPITGPLTVCDLFSINLGDASPGGTWFSSTPTVAQAGSTGIITGQVPGGGTIPLTSTITYTLPDNCAVSVNVTVNPLPPLFLVTITGSNSYCAGSPSTADIRLAGSSVGVTYALQLAGVTVNTVSGTGGPLDFGVQTAPGTYTVLGTNNVTGCFRNMPGSQTVSVNALPTAYPVSLTGGGAYCAGLGVSAPHVILLGSQSGVTYTLYLNGVAQFTSLSPQTGGGLALDFGTDSLPGTYTVIGVSTAGCATTMSGSAIVIVNPAPTKFNVTGGGGYCVGGSGVDVQLSFSSTGISYQLNCNGVPVMPAVLGTGGLIDFGIQTTVGAYTVVATNISTGCTATMNGAPNVFVNNPPNAYPLTGGGNYCAGTGGLNICIAPTDPGVSYQLYLGGVPQGSPLVGTGLPVCFGNQTTAGTYTVIATDPGTSCSNNMASSATIGINPVPTKYNVTGGGSYCTGGTGVVVGLGGSNSGISYALQLAGVTVNTLSGTGSPLNYGLETVSGTYTVIATNNVTHCFDTMNNSATVGVNLLPTPYLVNGTGAYCAGGTGVDVNLGFSESGVNYQLFRTGTGAVGGSVAGTGGMLDFGNQTTAGTYTVVGTNAATGCTNNMTGSAVVSINPLPAIHLVTGGGSYCSGGTGIDVGLNGSNSGINYTLYLGSGPVPGLTPMAGTGASLDFGLQTVAGTYTILATDATTGCFKGMTGGATVIVNPLPTVFSVTGGGSYCAGGTGVHVGLSGSSGGVKYQLYNGLPVGSPYTGSGSPIDFGAEIGTGTYTVIATNNSTGCVSNMTGSATVATNAAPTPYVVMGGGAYCAGGAGFDITLSGSDPTINYQLMMGTTHIGSSMPGTGSSLDFGMQTTAGTYTVVATNTVTGCTGNMTGNAVITINSLPTVYAVSGGGAYCSGGIGLHVFLNVSNTGISYQLYNGASPVGGAMSGTGSGLDFGAQTTAGTYTVVATNGATTCTNNMAGSATITINPLPGTYTVTGGGNYCPGGTGSTIGLSGSDMGINYSLVYGITPVGASVPGSGSAITFGLHTPTGSYSVVGTNAATGCSSNMTGSVMVALATPPTVYAVTGGGTYCATGTGVNVGVSSSDLNVNYQLYNGPSMSGIALPGTGGAIDFGRKTAIGNYTVIATDATGCTSNMSGSATITVNPVVLPHVNVTSSINGTVCVGQHISFSASPVNGGTAPTYQWMVNHISAGVGSTYTYVPLDGDVVTATIHSNETCAIPDTGSTSMTISVSPPEMPSATVAVSPGTLVCTGTMVNYTATPQYGGLAPALVWVKNGVAVGTGTTYSYVPSNGDIVTFMLGSNFNCRLADTVFSAPATMQVQDPVIPTVAVTVNPGINVAAQEQVTFTATVTHGGPALSYQWVVNSTVIPGATTATYTNSSLADKDSISCQVMGVCGLVGFNEVVVRVNRVGVQQITAGNSDVRLVPNPNKGEFTVKGTLASTVDQEVTFEITDMLGQVIYTNKVMTQNGSIDEHIKLSNALANGMYLLNMRSGTEHAVFHFVIEQ